MGLRFQKRIRLFPFVWLNISKSGASLTIGFPGFSFNIGRTHTTTTVGLPGTGVSYRTTKKHGIKP
jgi:hypothetical protein